MQYKTTSHNLNDRNPLQPLNANKNTLTEHYNMSRDYMEHLHSEYKQSSVMYIENASNENVEPSHIDNNGNRIHPMQSDLNHINHAQIGNNNLYLRRQNKSNNSISKISHIVNNQNAAIPPLRIELCSSNPVLCSANSCITDNDGVLLSSASSINSLSVGNAYNVHSASLSEVIPSENNNRKKKKANSLFNRITNLMSNRRSVNESEMNQDGDGDEDVDPNEDEDEHEDVGPGTFTPSTGNTPQLNRVITPIIAEQHYSAQLIASIIGKDTFIDDYLNELLHEENRNNALSWYNMEASYNLDQKIRKNAIDWICRVGIDWELQRATIYLSIYYFDKLCSSKQVNIYHLQMVAATCLLIAIKFNEKEEKVPSLYKLSRMCHKQYTPSSFKSMEIKLLNLMEFKLKTVLAIDFVSYYIDTGCIFEDDTLDNHGNLHLHAQSNAYLEKFGIFFLDISCQNYTFWNYLPSVLAFAVIIASRRALRIEPYFNNKLISKCKYHPKDITECFDTLWNEYHVKFPNDAKRAEILQPHCLDKYINNLMQVDDDSIKT